MVDSASKTTPRVRRKPLQARSVERVNRILAVAEALFIERGYEATTTKAIAAQAEVPIGSLYQFFPDKPSVLQALAERCAEEFHERIKAFDTPEMTKLPLKDYVDLLVGRVNEFYEENPGYCAIFMEVQANMPEVDEQADDELIQTVAALLLKRDNSLNGRDYEAIAFVLVKATGNLLWIAQTQSPEFRLRLIEETRRITLHYLQSYFPT